MARILSLDEMLVAASLSDMPGAAAFVQELREVAERLSAQLADHLEVDGPNETDFIADENGGGIMAGFAPLRANQPIPDAIKGFDVLGDWEPRAPVDRQRG